MFSFELYGNFKDLEGFLNDDSEIYSLLKYLKNMDAKLSETLYPIVNSSNPNAEINQAKSYLLESQKKLRIDYFKFFSEYEKLVGLVDKLKGNFSKGIVEDGFSEFKLSFQEYLGASTLTNFTKLVKKGSCLFSSLSILLKALMLSIDEVEKGKLDTESELLIYLSSEMDFKRFLSKLENIQAIYSELSELHPNHADGMDLRISKIESGSLFSKVFGNEYVINIMSGLFLYGAEATFDGINGEDEWEKLSTKTELVGKQLELAKIIYGEDGVPDEITDSMKKNFVVIIKETNDLLDGEREIVINEHRLAYDDRAGRLLHSTGSPTTMKMIENKPE